MLERRMTSKEREREEERMLIIEIMKILNGGNFVWWLIFHGRPRGLGMFHESRRVSFISLPLSFPFDCIFFSFIDVLLCFCAGRPCKIAVFNFLTCSLFRPRDRLVNWLRKFYIFAPS